MDFEDQLILEIKRTVIEDNFAYYIQVLTETAADTISDSSRRALIESVRAGGEPAIDGLNSMIRQIMIDTLASTLAVFDGSSVLPTMRDDFSILYDGKPVPQTLSDTLIESEEEDG
ncbi:MAG: hypothetical protein ACI8W8_001432 [Rhodothermales bacterium]|jgi:hypothetical protein